MLEVGNRHIDDVVELLRVLEVLDDLLGLSAERLVERESVGGLFVLHLEVVLYKTVIYRMSGRALESETGTEVRRVGGRRHERLTQQVDDPFISSLEQHEQILDHHSEGENGAFVLKVVLVPLCERIEREEDELRVGGREGRRRRRTSARTSESMIF